jgi:hypothetical protein
VSEGFEEVEITSHSEDAIAAIEDELKAARCRVSMHSPNSELAFVDVKIRQLKNVTRAITVLPYAVLLSIVTCAVMYVARR